MTYESYIGKSYPPYEMAVDAGRLKKFAQAIGANDPVHHDEAAAKAAGHSGLVAPPTFAFTILMDSGQLFNTLEDMDIPMTRTVHGNQSFIYHRPICAGDVVSGQQTIKSITARKGGALIFIDVENRLQNQDGEPVADLNSTVVVRSG